MAVIWAVDNMPDNTLLDLRHRHESILDRLEQDESPTILDEGQNVDSDFHKILVGATNNELLINAYNINSIRIRLIRLDRITLSKMTLPSAFEDHFAVLDAILKRDKNAAIAAIETHIR